MSLDIVIGIDALLKSGKLQRRLHATLSSAAGVTTHLSLLSHKRLQAGPDMAPTYSTDLIETTIHLEIN
ncbi:MAG: hypothetical protein QM688_01425 [Sphingomonas bacterium]